MSTSIIPVERIERVIFSMRGQKVMLDIDLARLYGVSTGRLNQAVKRNSKRFPDDFIFQLDEQEIDNLKSQIAISSWGGRRRSRPYAFTEQGVAMLSSVLRSPRAVQVNVEIMRTFVRLRRMLQSHAELARKLDALEQKYDKQFKVVFDAIRQLMEPPPEKKRPPIGFHTVHLTDDERTSKRLSSTDGNASKRKAPATGRGLFSRKTRTNNRKAQPGTV